MTNPWNLANDDLRRAAAAMNLDLASHWRVALKQTNSLGVILDVMTHAGRVCQFVVRYDGGNDFGTGVLAAHNLASTEDYR